mmetsp:Transcript_42485/g.83512  ORF Transcript_42485/g.83512 Transcript_42485/m.83512 type:complete len:202 (+) Transcript_42485:363-968(+)
MAYASLWAAKAVGPGGDTAATLTSPAPCPSRTCTRPSHRPMGPLKSPTAIRTGADEGAPACAAWCAASAATRSPMHASLTPALPRPWRTWTDASSRGGPARRRTAAERRTLTRVAWTVETTTSGRGANGSTDTMPVSASHSTPSRAGRARPSLACIHGPRGAQRRARRCATTSTESSCRHTTSAVRSSSSSRRTRATTRSR